MITARRGDLKRTHLGAWLPDSRNEIVVETRYPKGSGL